MLQIPDVFDYIKYDAIHNHELLGEVASRLFDTIKPLADFLVPHEYGIETADKLHIGRTTCELLLRSMWKDLETMKTPLPTEPGQPDPTPRVHIYCGSESHLQPLRNVLFQSNVVPINCSWDCYNELNYLTHVVLKLYRYDDADYEKLKGSPPGPTTEQYYVELDWSPGVIEDVFAMAEEDHALPFVEAFALHPHITLDEMHEILVPEQEGVPPPPSANESAE